MVQNLETLNPFSNIYYLLEISSESLCDLISNDSFSDCNFVLSVRRLNISRIRDREEVLKFLVTSLINDRNSNLKNKFNRHGNKWCYLPSVENNPYKPVPTANQPSQTVFFGFSLGGRGGATQ